MEKGEALAKTRVCDNYGQVAGSTTIVDINGSVRVTLNVDGEEFELTCRRNGVEVQEWRLWHLLEKNPTCHELVWSKWRSLPARQ